METYELPYQDRVVRFTGERIASTSSRQTESLRWTTVDIYRTQGGSYILSRQGHSRVYHSDDSSCNTKLAKRIEIDEIDDDVYDELEPCPVCKPKYLDDFIDNAFIYQEQVNPSVVVANSPRGLVEAGYSTDRDGIVFMNRVTERALREAATIDSAVREEFLVETID